MMILAGAVHAGLIVRLVQAVQLVRAADGVAVGIEHVAQLRTQEARGHAHHALGQLRAGLRHPDAAPGLVDAHGDDLVAQRGLPLLGDALRAVDDAQNRAQRRAGAVGVLAGGIGQHQPLAEVLAIEPRRHGEGHVFRRVHARLAHGFEAHGLAALLRLGVGDALHAEGSGAGLEIFRSFWNALLRIFK